MRTHLDHPEVSPASAPRRRIVLATLGSLGDLHPYIAIALGLQARGHMAVLAAGQCYQQKIEALGLEHKAIRPNSDWVSNPDVMKRFTHLHWGLLRVGREWILPALRQTYDDIRAACTGADLLVSHPLAAYAARLVAEKAAIPWVSTMPVPLGFFSSFDQSLFSAFGFTPPKQRWLGPSVCGPLLRLGKRATRFVARPWYRLRAELGLLKTHEANPLGDSHAPLRVLALFSQYFADKQPDWPSQTVITGFPFHDGGGLVRLPPALAQFLDKGPPPIVFTLGSAVSCDAGNFFEHSVAAARRLGQRAVLVLKDAGNRLPALPAGIIAVDYAPFSELFPRASAIVHHGGIGTTGLAMWSQRPMLIMPCAWDQPDHADRLARLGLSRTIPRRHYTPRRAAVELRKLLDEPAYARRALEIGERVRKEDGVKTACDALEQILKAGHVALSASK